MPADADPLEERLSAVERALTDTDREFTDLRDAAALADRLDAAERDREALDARVSELEAAVQALRGYVGNVRSVNREIERRADAALSTVDDLDERLETLEARGDAPADGGDRHRTTDDRTTGPRQATASPRPPSPGGDGLPERPADRHGDGAVARAEGSTLSAGPVGVSAGSGGDRTSRDSRSAAPADAPLDRLRAWLSG